MADEGSLALPVVYSVLSPAALCDVITAAYALMEPVDCRVFRLGVNDTYLIRTAADTYMLRIYRADWRSHAYVQYEVDLLLHLQAKGDPVAAPVARRDGTFVGLLSAPEGQRCAVLFTYAPGTVPAANEMNNVLFGRAVGRLHTAAATFESSHQRPAADLAVLLDYPPPADRAAHQVSS